MSIQSINPATEEVIESFEPYTTAQVNQALEQAHAAYLDWRETTFAERGSILHRVASYLRENKWNCDFYADNAEKFLSDEHVASNATESYVSYPPLGVILALRQSYGRAGFHLLRHRVLARSA